MLFQGEEWGATAPFQYFTDHQDPDLADAVSEGRRHEFEQFGGDPGEVPDPQVPSTFEASKLDWEEITRPQHAELLAWYRRLIALRRQIASLSEPRLDRTEVDVDDEHGCLVMSRGPVKVLVNLGGSEQRFTPERPTRDLAISDASVRRDGTDILVPPDAVAVVAQCDAPRLTVRSLQ